MTPLGSKKNAPFDQPGKLMLATVRLLKDRDIFEVYAATKLSPYWLRKFANLELKNPSVNRVEYLHHFLVTGTLRKD
jgi:hypothetical protein